MSDQAPHSTAPHPFPGKLIIVEGIDGSGKSTQLLLLNKWLESKGHKVFFTEWNSSELVKDTTKRGKKNKSLTPTTFSLLHATDFASRLYHEITPPLKAGMDMNLSQDVTESFRIFQSRILAQYDKIVDEYQLISMDATKDIAQQQDAMRRLVDEALKDYKPRRGTHGRRSLFWRRFDVPKSE